MDVPYMLAAAARAATNNENTGVSYGVLFPVLSASIILIGVAVRLFDTESRLEETRYDAMKDARSGFASGRLDPALSDLIEEVLTLREKAEDVSAVLDRIDLPSKLARIAEAGSDRASAKPILVELVEEFLRRRENGEPIIDVLTRSDVTDAVNRVAAAVVARDAIDATARRLVKWSTALAVSMVVVVMSGVSYMLDPIAGHEMIPDGARTAGLVLLSGSAAILLACGVVVRQLKLALSRAIRDGKDAAGGS